MPRPTLTAEEKAEMIEEFSKIINSDRPFILVSIGDVDEEPCDCGNPDCSNGASYSTSIINFAPSEIAEVIHHILESEKKVQHHFAAQSLEKISEIIQMKTAQNETKH